jgi:hypothetical protein
MPKIKMVNVGPSATSSIKIQPKTTRGGPLPKIQPLRPVDPVVKIPYRQHTFSDGTIGAPNWCPENVDANSDLGRAANRSYEATAAQLNPYGSPKSDKRGQVPDSNAPQPSRIGTSSAGIGDRVRRKVVGSRTGADPLTSTQGGPRNPRNPTASLKKG